jgi:2-dehydro-3-deoxyphosphogluconate aldolase/(4S)-4-hydroxy-2-oxoglutarate aldolase
LPLAGFAGKKPVMTTDPQAIFRRMPVVPVLTIEDPAEAVPLGRALAAGGLTTLEVTLRTSAALEAIRRLREELPQCLVGAGTLLSPAHVAEAVKAGAQFLVSPGTTAVLAKSFRDTGLPALPGAATVSEVLALRDMGFVTQKFFPAEASGGIAWLKSVTAPVADVAFCPTGGIDLAKARDYLALKNVMCVGGSWVVPAKAVAAKDWPKITRLAREALALRQD